MHVCMWYCLTQKLLIFTGKHFEVFRLVSLLLFVAEEYRKF